ncbi:ARM repeat-containing protein [Dacryopinax primogenitus]|uniref:ARM repeat-containing protein n=1 Tax=Dacryopinax primogenitus (strain DJM 731) TaxID=1858805 RepID=M5FN67_DACPD|nr:ARM repeat-containing protein [Dacryopinax primogenitus]EJT96915.1 ARM repeat-containing protein [Dacryopinax primogenitus]
MAQEKPQQRVATWLASVSSTGEDDDSQEELKTFEDFLRFARGRITSGQTKARTGFIQDKLLYAVEKGGLEPPQLLAIFLLLTLTYPRYSDRPSRSAVLQVLCALLSSPSAAQVTPKILAWLSKEVDTVCRPTPSTAISNRFVLLSWSLTAYEVLAPSGDFQASAEWKTLVGTLARAFDSVLRCEGRHGVQYSALTSTRRSVRKAHTAIPVLVETLAQLASGSAPAVQAEVVTPLVGVAVDVSLRLKGKLHPVGEQYLASLKPIVLKLICEGLILSRTPLPLHTIPAVKDFLGLLVTPQDWDDTLMPATTKAFLRTPEVSLKILSDIVAAYPSPLPALASMLSATLNHAKATNPATRTGALALFSALLANEPQLQAQAGKDVLAALSGGKTASPEHRQTLYQMVLALPPSVSRSPSAVQTLIPLFSKEVNEPALSALSQALAAHLRFCISQDIPLLPDQAKALSKELSAQKVALRRAAVRVLGAALYLPDTEEGQAEPTKAAEALAAEVASGLEGALKAVSTNPLNSAAGPLEGYVAIALISGPLSRHGSKPLSALQKNAVMKSVLSVGAKPSFFLWDRVYKRATTAEDELWLLRAAAALLHAHSAELRKNEPVRVALGAIFVYLGLDSTHFEMRRETVAMVKACTARHPIVTNAMLRDAVRPYLVLHSAKPTVVKADDEAAKVTSPVERLSELLDAASTFAQHTVEETRIDILTEWIVLSHYLDPVSAAQISWIEMVQKARLDPNVVVIDRLQRVQELIDEALIGPEVRDLPWRRYAPSTQPEKQKAFRDAAARAATTAAFVAGETATLSILDRIQADLTPELFKRLTTNDLAIWATPEGALFVDVLAAKKPVVADKNRKDYAIEKWEQELRQSVAAKKAGKTVTLSKQDQALVDAQLAKESEIRNSINRLQRQAERGLALVRSLVQGDNETFHQQLYSVVNLLLAGVLSHGSALAGSAAFDTYLELSKCVSPRISETRRWIGISTLRAYNLAVVPPHLEAESVTYVVTRVLYRLRSLAEQSPFDPTSFMYITPLLTQLVSIGGIPLNAEDAESQLEQLALCLDLMRFHCSAFSEPLYPRLDIISSLLKLIAGYSKLLQTASTALVGIAESMKDNASPGEIRSLVQGTLYQEQYVRNACLQALQPVDLTEMDFSPELWIACHDDDEQNARLAFRVWEDNGLDVSDDFAPQLVPFLEHSNVYVRTSCASAIAEAASTFPDRVPELLRDLQALYLEKAKILTPEYDAYGMVIPDSLDRPDPWPVRVAIALSFEQLAESFTAEQLVPFFDFLLNQEALGDRRSDVRSAMLSAATTVIDLHGNAKLSELVSMFELYLGKKGKGSETQDWIKEAVVILIGRVARHLALSDDRIPKIVDRLIAALKTPSEVVQSAVAECLPPLVKGTTVDVTKLVDRLMEELVNAPKYAERRGAAYGLAGVMKGRGLAGIKEFNVMERLRDFMEDKKRFESRQGALFAFETLSATLGRTFEPYIIQDLTLLLSAFGDSQPDVREATQDATRVIMSRISGYGVKVILPDLLSGLEEKQWRTKRGSIEMLGSMAYCAPKELSLSLPTVIPRLTGVLTDSHTQVRAAANQSLKRFGEVINNPEIRNLVPVLLKALVDPATKTPSALRALLDTSFAHYIDSPSLALVVPIVERGLRERGADTKRRSAQIVGNLASLTDSKDFVPYLDKLIPLVRIVLVDPVPEARATAAKALGTLVERLGEDKFPDLMPGLLQTLKTDTSGVDRQGAAQGLSEVLSGLGMERMEALLPDILVNARSTRPYIREGFMSLLVYLPATFGTRFAPHIPRIIPPVLDGLADDGETVREVSMRAGRIIIGNYSKTAIDLLLPELENGMFDPGWRIRQSSITLVGELLFKISGISGKNEIEEDAEDGEEDVGGESSRKVLVTVLGKERRDRVLAALYIVRQDAVAVVRQASVHIWKALVQNTPRTVRDILPALINLEITLLASEGGEQRETAARTMGELCRKLGEKILGAIIPILKAGSGSENRRTREGVCLALCEIMNNTTDTQRESHEEGIIAAVRDSLVDESPTVRAAAAQAFDVMQERIGPKAIDQTIPTLLHALRQPGESAQTALQALKEVMAVRAATVLPALLPTLLATPITSFNARALKSLVSVAGRALSRRLNQILGTLVKALETENDEEIVIDIQQAVEALLGAIVDPEGLNTCMMILLGWAKNESSARRASAAKLFARFCQVAQLEISDYRVDWIRQLVTMLDDREQSVVDSAAISLDTLVKTTDKDELESMVVPMRRTLESLGAPGRHVPGFTNTKGIAPLVPIILTGLTGGTNEQKEQAAYAIGDIVERASEPAIKPYVVQLTGPLIRVITQATTFPPQVKSAILSSLTIMLTTIPTFVKPFFPQLQRTFIKSASDPASLSVRNRAAVALGVLMALQTRVDPVVTELMTGARSGEPEIRSSMAVALAAVVKGAGKSVGEVARSSLLELVSDTFAEPVTESYNSAIADLFAALALHDESLTRSLAEAQLTPQTPPSAMASLSIVSFLETVPDAFYTYNIVPGVVRKVIVSINMDTPAISRPAREARELLKNTAPYVDDETVHTAF